MQGTLGGGPSTTISPRRCFLEERDRREPGRLLKPGAGPAHGSGSTRRCPLVFPPTHVCWLARIIFTSRSGKKLRAYSTPRRFISSDLLKFLRAVDSAQGRACPVLAAVASLINLRLRSSLNHEDSTPVRSHTSVFRIFV